jgi:Tfp pilus assembly protein PilV
MLTSAFIALLIIVVGATDYIEIQLRPYKYKKDKSRK